MRNNYSAIMVGIAAVLFLIAGFMIGQNNGIRSNGNANRNGSIGGAQPTAEKKVTVIPTGENVSGSSSTGGGRNGMGEGQESAEKKGEMIVRFTDNGFEPAIVTVKRGDMVKFINESSITEMWVASNPHPQHTDYPGFDQQQGVKKDGQYTFGFQNAGIWSYHNHLSPEKTGRIVVL